MRWRTLQLLIGLGLVAGAFVGLWLWNQAQRPRTYSVVVAAREIPPFTPLAQARGRLAVMPMAVPELLLRHYVLEADLPGLLADGVVVEALRPGEPLHRQKVASGENAGKVRRLSVALSRRDVVIRTIPVDPKTTPDLTVGDVVDLYVALGSVRAEALVSSTALLTNSLEAPLAASEGMRASLMLPAAKRVVAGALVARLRFERVPNPAYGAPGNEGAPPFLEGDLRAVDVILPETAAERVDWALAVGKVSVGLRPALWREAVEAGKELPPTAGFTWTDFERRFFEEREAADGKR